MPPLPPQREIAQDLIEKLCEIVADYDTELKSTDNEKTHDLTERNNISVGAEHFRCVDILFQPNSIDK